jgi:AraC-like DNA-binding protein
MAGIMERYSNILPDQLRIQRAQSALASTDEPVTSIALRCGFSTSQYFSNVFRKQFGLTPSKFRKRERQTHAISRDFRR